jgi:hypothetical protein
MRTTLWLSLLAAPRALAHVVPGQVFPNMTQTWDMNASSISMICNSTGYVDPVWGSKGWGLLDIDWNSAKPIWSATKPMSVEEYMVDNCNAIDAASGGKTKCWVCALVDKSTQSRVCR